MELWLPSGGLLVAIINIIVGIIIMIWPHVIAYIIGIYLIIIGVLGLIAVL